MKWIIKRADINGYVCGSGILGNADMRVGEYGRKSVKIFNTKADAQKYLRDHIADKRWKVEKYSN